MSALREKTVILVTHQVEFLSEVDKILVCSILSHGNSVLFFEHNSNKHILSETLGNGGRENNSIRWV